MRAPTNKRNDRFGLTIVAGIICVVLVSTVSCRAPRRMAAVRGKAPDPPVSTPYGVQPAAYWRERQFPEVRATIPQVANAEMVNDDQLCTLCHESHVKHHTTNLHHAQSCEACHGPASEHIRTRGKEPGLIRGFQRMKPAERSETCLQCHEDDACDPGSRWRISAHANAGVACTDCHTGHYNVPPGSKSTDLTKADTAGEPIQLVRLPETSQETIPPPSQAAGHALAATDASIRADSRNMGAITPHVCYRCHADMARQQQVGHPHQICGAVGFDCATCHDPHGKVRPETRTDLCLKCHDMKAPTMAWHSSTHFRYGVACADCHDPHPNSYVQPVVGIQHTHIEHKPRSPMSVDEPQACYKCHQDVYAENAMPSHHPIKEGKMVCSDCHDPHGQTEGNLTEPTVNMVCYKCHAEKQGPFAYEHPPVTENCAICHNPHGTVTNNLLRQPVTFLCLRCHTGHRTGPPPGGPDHGPLMHDVGTSPALQAAFYTDCTQCHSQIHGSDLPSPHLPKAFMR